LILSKGYIFLLCQQLFELLLLYFVLIGYCLSTIQPGRLEFQYLIESYQNSSLKGCSNKALVSFAIPSLLFVTDLSRDVGSRDRLAVHYIVE
jgi:hypothetical protein